MDVGETKLLFDAVGAVLTVLALLMITAGACGAPIVISAWTAVFLSLAGTYVLVKSVQIIKS